MLSRFIRLSYSSLAKDLNLKMSEVEARISKIFPASVVEGTNYSLPATTPQKTMDEKLAELDNKVAKIEALREIGRPEEIRIKNLPMKYGRTGRHPAYPWYGEAVAQEDRIPYLADRIGSHSTQVPGQSMANDWLHMKSDLYNPLFHSFFVQPPTLEPDPDVDFEKGEIIYDNSDAFQGVSLARQTCYTGLLYGIFYGFHTLYTGRTVYPIANEGMDHRSEGTGGRENYLGNLYSWGTGTEWHDLETLINISFVVPMIPLGLVSIVGFIEALTGGVATRLRFNKDKDLVFVTKVKGIYFPREVEEVYETTHLQVLPPAPKSGYENVSERTVFTISCMNTHTNFRVSNDPIYWNPELREDFYQHLHSLWE